MTREPVSFEKVCHWKKLLDFESQKLLSLKYIMKALKNSLVGSRKYNIKLTIITVSRNTLKEKFHSISLIYPCLKSAFTLIYI